MKNGIHKERKTLTEKHRGARDQQKVAVRLPDGSQIDLSPGKHNELQRLILEEFAPRFASGALLIYLGDTAKKDRLLHLPSFNRIGLKISSHEKLPDVILLDEDRDWIFLIEAVTSHGPVSPKRLEELSRLLTPVRVPPVYVTAFLNFSDFHKYGKDIAWETEVWIAEHPDHMIHYNGDRFLGPRS